RARPGCCRSGHPPVRHNWRNGSHETRLLMACRRPRSGTGRRVACSCADLARTTVLARTVLLRLIVTRLPDLLHSAHSARPQAVSWPRASATVPCAQVDEVEDACGFG